MLTMHQRSVNVDRQTLLAKLKENLEIHRQDYLEAVEGYKVKVTQDLAAALKIAKNKPAAELKDLDVDFNFPVSYADQYVDIIEMMEMSVDATINLDSQSFKAYIKNEWSWSRSFHESATMYKTFAAGAAGRG